MFLKMETTSKKIMQPTTIKSKDNNCGTAPGNLVFISDGEVFIPNNMFNEFIFIVYNIDWFLI